MYCQNIKYGCYSAIFQGQGQINDLEKEIVTMF